MEMGKLHLNGETKKAAKQLEKPVQHCRKGEILSDRGIVVPGMMKIGILLAFQDRLLPLYYVRSTCLLMSSMYSACQS